MELADLREYFGVEVESESRTVAGLVIEQLEQIPPAGTSVRVDGLELTIRRVEENRIVEIEVRKTP
jgi:CBS domain containing-hemolysin-like protein